MPESFVGLPPDSTGKKHRTRQRTIGANTIEEPYVIPVSERNTLNTVMVSTYRTLGAAALTQNLLTIENQVGSGRLCAVRRISVQMDATAVLVAVAPHVIVNRTTAMPSGGTILPEMQFDTAQTNSAQILARGATASNGGAATAITATPAAGQSWSQYTMRIATSVGQIVMDDQSVIPLLAENTPIILREGQALVVQVVAAATTSNPATNNWLVNALYEGYTLP